MSLLSESLSLSESVSESVSLFLCTYTHARARACAWQASLDVAEPILFRMASMGISPSKRVVSLCFDIMSSSLERCDSPPPSPDMTHM